MEQRFLGGCSRLGKPAYVSTPSFFDKGTDYLFAGQHVSTQYLPFFDGYMVAGWRGGVGVVTLCFVGKIIVFFLVALPRGCQFVHLERSPRTADRILTSNTTLPRGVAVWYSLFQNTQQNVIHCTATRPTRSTGEHTRRNKPDRMLNITTLTACQRRVDRD